MKISFLCSDPNHPVIPYLTSWINSQAVEHEVVIVSRKTELTSGEILFLISCTEIIGPMERCNFLACLVLHASDLPQGRGWSPHIWELARGESFITLSLLEADDKLDRGRIWKKITINIPKYALWDEINHLLFTAEIALIEYAIDNFEKIIPIDQAEVDCITYYTKRTPKDSEIDPHKTIAEQFDNIRICDPNRFPAYFYYLGRRFVLKVERCND